MNDVLLYSGGMDSYIAWHYLRKPKTIYVNLGHRYVDKELDAIALTIPDTVVLLCDWVGQHEQPDAFIPSRNLLLATAASILGYDEIYLIAQKDEMSLADRSQPFFEQTSSLLSMLLEKKVRVSTPFAEVDKTDMVQWYVDNDLDVTQLLQTVGCYRSTSGHCGNCPACLRRWVALMNNDIHPGYDLHPEILNIYKTNLKSYSIKRQTRMKKWL